MGSFSLQDYRSLADFAQQIRRYIRETEKTDRNLDLQPQQDQLLLALKALPRTVRPRISELAQQLQVQHHSAVILVDGLENKGLVRRERGTHDRREVLVRLTSAGEGLANELAGLHFAALSSRKREMVEALQRASCSPDHKYCGD